MVEVASVFSTHFVHQLLSFLDRSFGLRGRLATRFVVFTRAIFGFFDITHEGLHFRSIRLRLLHSLLDLLLHVGQSILKLLLNLLSEFLLHFFAHLGFHLFLQLPHHLLHVFGRSESGPRITLGYGS